MTAIEALADFIVSGRIFDVMLVVLAAEVAWLAWRRRGVRGPVLAPLIANAGAGAALVLSFKAILAGAGWPWVAAALLASLVCHVADLAYRHRRDRSARTAPDKDTRN